MKKVFEILDRHVQGLSAIEAKSLMPGRVIKETDPANFEDLFKKVAIAASQGKAGLRMNFQQQKMCSHFKDELRALGYEIIETDLKWAPGDNIAYDKMLDPADVQKIDTFEVIERVKAEQEEKARKEEAARIAAEEEARVIAEQETSKVLDKEPEPVVQSSVKPSNDEQQNQVVEEPQDKKGFFGRMVDKVTGND